MPSGETFATDQPATDWLGSRVVRPAMSIDEKGLSFYAGPRLARMTKEGKLAFSGEDRERALALLSVGYRQPASPTLFDHIKVAAGHWRRGDKALANLRLVFAGLPRLDAPGDVARLRAAEWLLDEGVAPRVLMKELGLDPATLDLRKYDPNQPRVPAGSGPESGRWSDGPIPVRLTDLNISGVAEPRVRVAANGPLKPDGITALPSPAEDLLDPQNLNKEPPSPLEQQAIVDTLNIIRGGAAEDIKKLNPHSYQNLPNIVTGAVLPPNIIGYTSYTVRPYGGNARGQSRLLMSPMADTAYYTNNH